MATTVLPAVKTPDIAIYNGGSLSGLRCGKGLWGLSWAKLVLAILILILSIAALAMKDSVWLVIKAGIDGSGIWGGIFFIITAAIGLVAIKQRSRCMLTAYLVLAILSVCLFGIITFALASTWAGVVKQRSYALKIISDSPFFQSPEIMEQNVASGQAVQGILDGVADKLEVASGLYAAVAAFVGIYIILAIVVSAILCTNICSCCQRNQVGGSDPRVSYSSGELGGGAAPVYR